MPASPARSRKPRMPSTKIAADNGKKQEYVNEHQNKKLLGEVITWHPGAGSTYSDVMTALKAEGLKDTVCRELMPKQAFGRAAHKMVEDRVIDVANEDANEIAFQFTKKYRDADEWVYTMDCVLRLDKQLGRVRCPSNPALEQKAQELVDKATDARTSGDVSKMVQKLFEAEADLFPVREQGGVYFVPDEHTAFTDKIEAFLKRLGGRVSRFPVPAGTAAGDRSVADAVGSGLDAMLTEQADAVKEFGVTTRNDTLKNQADRINQARAKVRAYAHYLGERSKELEAAADLADKRLEAKITELTAERAANPQISMGGNRANIFTFSVTSVIRWMGKKGWSFKQGRAVVTHYTGVDAKGDPLISDATVRAQLLGGRTGERGDPAPLSPAQEAELEAAKTGNYPVAA